MAGFLAKSLGQFHFGPVRSVALRAADAPMALGIRVDSGASRVLDSLAAAGDTHGMADNDLAVAVVTGGAGGIGRALAVRLARDGFAIGVLDRDRAGADATCEAV